MPPALPPTKWRRNTALVDIVFRQGRRHSRPLALLPADIDLWPQAVVGAADLRAAAQPAFRPTRACRSLSSDFQGRWTALSALSAGSGTNPLPGRTEHALALRRASATRRPMSGLGVPRCCRRSDVTRALLTKISPSSGCSNPASSISVVALPEPDGPS